jgi:hypothetical protein
MELTGAHYFSADIKSTTGLIKGMVLNKRNCMMMVLFSALHIGRVNLKK